MSDLIAIARNQRRLNLRTHYEGCDADHIECLVVKLANEVERLRAEVERLHGALYRIAGKVPVAHDPWSIARDALKEDGR
jgi:hypothetical protein